MRKKAGLAAGEVWLLDDYALPFCPVVAQAIGTFDGQVSGGELRTLFAAMDLDENGSVSLAEFQQFVSYR